MEIILKYFPDLTETQKQQFASLYDLYTDWNAKINVISRKDIENLYEHHVLHSLGIAKVTRFVPGTHIMDLGTGGGFPGIPLKIAFPELKITLLDSLNKRVGFLNEVIEALELKDIEAVHGRAEDFARDKEHRAAYDICVSRAVANLSTLSEYCLPFVKMGGCFVSYKSGECESEVADAKSAIYLLGGKLNRIEQFGYSDNHRSFVIIDKVMNTSNKYPRKAGLPSKKPL